jgi:membrane associated rhomboid family serine protease
MGFFNVAGGVAIFAYIGGFIIGMIMSLTIGLNRKKEAQNKIRA